MSVFAPMLMNMFFGISQKVLENGKLFRILVKFVQKSEISQKEVGRRYGHIWPLPSWVDGADKYRSGNGRAAPGAGPQKKRLPRLIHHWKWTNFKLLNARICFENRTSIDIRMQSDLCLICVLFQSWDATSLQDTAKKSNCWTSNDF